MNKCSESDFIDSSFVCTFLYVVATKWFCIVDHYNVNANIDVPAV